MPPTQWPQFITLSAIIVLTIAAALQAGGTLPWSWTRFAKATLVLAALYCGSIVAGLKLYAALGSHGATLAVVGGSVAAAMLGTVAALMRRRA